MKLTVNTVTGYGPAIENMLVQEFPAFIDKKNNCQLIETLEALLNATAQRRYGPIPPPETRARVRGIITAAVKAGLPIPLLMPWGTKKPSNAHSIDIAELMALKALVCLHRQVEAIYPAGLHLRIRVEDLSGFYLFSPEGAEALEASKRYITDFTSLWWAMGKPGSLVFETDLMDRNAYQSLADHLVPYFFDYLKYSDGEDQTYSLKADLKLNDLKAQGWAGMIPKAQREFYYSRFLQVDGAIDARLKTARYFASVLARKTLEGYGSHGWEDYIALSYSPPVPGTPDALASRQLYWRTLPLSAARTHLSPWRGRGYIISNGGALSPKLTNWKEELQGAHLEDTELLIHQDGRPEPLSLRFTHVIND